MVKKKSDNIFLYFYSVLIVMLTWPIFAAWIEPLEKFWRWYPIGVIYGFFFIREYFFTKQFRWFVVYSAIVLLNCFMGDKYVYDPIEVTLRLCGLLFMTSAPFLLLRNSYERYGDVIFYMFLILLIFTTIVSYFFNLQFPDVVRNDPTSTGLTDFYEFSYLYRFGLTQYQFAHAIPVLIPPCVMVFRNAKNSIIKKTMGLSLSFLCIIHAYVSGSTTAFIFALMAFAMSFVLIPGSSKRNIQRVVVVAILLVPFLSDSFLSGFLGIVDNIFGAEGSIHEHILDIQESITSNRMSGDVGERQNMYQTSWKLFIESPIWGTNNLVGNHSVFLDHLAAFGILGLIPFILFLWYQFKYVQRRIFPSYQPYYFVCAICAFGMFAFKNVSLWTICCFLFVAAPLFFIHLGKENK